MYQFIAQAIGFFSTALQAISFQCKSSRKLMLVQLGGIIAFLIHLLMLGAYSGCISLTVSCFRNIIMSSRKPWSYWQGWLWILVIGNILGVVATWENIFSILPCLGVVAITLASWSRNGKTIRIANLFIASPAWIIYDFHSESYPGILTEILIFSSVVISIVRYGWDALDNTD